MTNAKWTGEFRKRANNSRNWLVMGVLVALSACAQEDEMLSGFGGEGLVYGEVTASEARAIVNQNCQSCHQRGIAGAPRIGSTEDWSRLLAERDLEALVTNAVQGVGRMPPKGYCRQCSRAELAAAVMLMLPASLTEEPSDENLPAGGD